MLKVFKTKAIGLAALALPLMFASCNMMDETNNSSKNYVLSGSYQGATGSLSINNSSRFIDTSSITKAIVSVASSDFEALSTTVDCSNGKGSITIDGIPVGRNRVVTVQACNGSEELKDIVISNVTDIESGNNSIDINWDTTAVGNVYKALLSRKAAIASYSSTKDEEIKASIPTVKGYLVDADSIAEAAISDTLQAGLYYINKAATCTFTVYGFDNGTLTVSDPLSKSYTISGDEATVEVTDIAPGSWTYYVNGTNKGSITVASSASEVKTIGTKTFVFSGIQIQVKKDAGYDHIYAWEGQTGLVGSWPGCAMEERGDCYVYDFDDKSSLSFLITNGSGAKYVDKDMSVDAKGSYLVTSSGPQASTYISKGSTLSDDRTLSGIYVNGDYASKTSGSYTVPYTTESVKVTAIPNSDVATATVSPSGEVSLGSGESASFTITVVAEDGTSEPYIMKVTRDEAPIQGDTRLTSISAGNTITCVQGQTEYSTSLKGSNDSTTITVNAVAKSSEAKVSCSPSSLTISDGSTEKATITVTNDGKSSTYTVSVSYTKVDSSGPYSTNGTGFGVEKTISSFSDWDTSMIIAQGACNDDPRAFRGYHEKAVDFYALFAAYDDSNLYLMVEMPSIDGRDLTSKDWQYALDENLGMGIGINTGKRTAGDGEMDNGATVWNKSKMYSITQGIDTIIQFHPAEYGTPCCLLSDSNGKFSYTANSVTWKEGGISTDKKVGLVSKSLIGRKDNYGLTQAEYLAKDDFEEITAEGYMYQITIPYKAIGITKDDIKTNGIGVMTFSTFGTSMMDALPWCSDLISCASEGYSCDSSTSAEKEDVDTYDVPLARVGK